MFEVHHLAIELSDSNWQKRKKFSDREKRNRKKWGTDNQKQLFSETRMRGCRARDVFCIDCSRSFHRWCLSLFAPSACTDILDRTPTRPTLCVFSGVCSTLYMRRIAPSEIMPPWLPAEPCCCAGSTLKRERENLTYCLGIAPFRKLCLYRLAIPQVILRPATASTQ